MKKETIVVPQNQCPLDTIANLGRRTRNAWIFVHKNVIEKFERDDSNTESIDIDTNAYTFKWEATEEYYETIISIDNSNYLGFTWCRVVYINAIDIAFETSSDDPDEVFFIKMAA